MGRLTVMPHSSFISQAAALLCLSCWSACGWRWSHGHSHCCHESATALLLTPDSARGTATNRDRWPLLGSDWQGGTEHCWVTGPGMMILSVSHCLGAPHWPLHGLADIFPKLAHNFSLIWHFMIFKHEGGQNQKICSESTIFKLHTWFSCRLCFLL